MKYSIAIVSNGNFRIAEEGFTVFESAVVRFHNYCETMWNSSDVETGCVMIADEKMQCVNGYRELIKWNTQINA